jgi:hypothetical protein
MRRIILWDHERGSWQYDVFCLLIIAFIFLTPKSWFERAENVATRQPQAIVKTGSLVPTRMTERAEDLDAAIEMPKVSGSAGLRVIRQGVLYRQRRL